jgi:hypothetical protein
MGARHVAVALASGLACVLAPCAAHAAPTLYSIYAVWMQGEGDGDRANLDAFLDCLVNSSNYASYWGGAAILSYEGSWDIAPPAAAVNTQGCGAWVDAAIKAGKVPHHSAGSTPVYLVLGSSASMNMDNVAGACGRNAPGTVDGVTAGIATVRASPMCWGTGVALRSDTQLGEHEVAEVIDQLMGFWGCAGDGSCEGSSTCGTSACDNFTGLSCAGAPATTQSGCNGVSVNGWLVQRLSHTERMPNQCDICTTCDFTVQLGCAGGGKTVNQPCAKATDCCSGLACKEWSYSGKPPYATACCKDVGQACVVGTDCCGGSNCDPTSHKCACVPLGQWCINADECCTGATCDLAQSKCVPAPPDAGTPAADAGTGSDAGARPPAVDASFGVDAGGAEAGDAAQGGGADSGCSCSEAPRESGGASGAAGLAALALLAAFSGRRRGSGSRASRNRRGTQSS